MTYPEDQEFTLTLGGTATLTTDYTISPADADSGETGHQATLTAGEDELEVTFTAVEDTTEDESETVLVTVSYDGDDIGTRQDITINEGGSVNLIVADISH